MVKLMKSQTVKEIIETIDAIYNEKFTPIKIKIWSQVLASYSDDAILEALNSHVSDPVAGKWPPKPADVIAKMPAKPTSMSSDEAWSVCVMSFDEGKSLVWNDRIAQARAAALPIWVGKDAVGARMAFKAAYDRLSGFASEAPILSLGHAKGDREEAVTKALALGLISSQRAQQLLPGETAPEVKEAMKLLTSPGGGGGSAQSRMASIIKEALTKAEAKKAENLTEEAKKKKEKEQRRIRELERFREWQEELERFREWQKQQSDANP